MSALTAWLRASAIDATTMAPPVESSRYRPAEPRHRIGEAVRMRRGDLFE